MYVVAFNCSCRTLFPVDLTDFKGVEDSYLDIAKIILCWPMHFEADVFSRKEI